MGQRIPSHRISERSLTKIKGWSENNDFVYRELSGRDYGVDAIIELFENGENVTGKIAFLQLKGMEDAISMVIGQCEIWIDAGEKKNKLLNVSHEDNKLSNCEKSLC